MPFEILAAGVIGWGGAILGWWLSNRSTSARDLERRQRDVAEQWIEALVDVRLGINRRSSRSEVTAAATEWQRAWMRFSGRLPSEVADRVEPLHLVMLIYKSDTPDQPLDARSSGGPRGEDWAREAAVLEIAFQSAICALDAFSIGAELPPRSFPTSAELFSLIADHGEDGMGLGEVVRLTNDLPSPPSSRRASGLF